jgi:flagellar basal-body rod protein FlgB
VDPLLSTVEYALGGLQLRLDTVAHNIANSNTPGFRAEAVDFESNLLAALRRGQPAPGTGARKYTSDGLTDNNGNTVSLESEMTEMTKSSLERQVIVSAFNYKIDMLRSGAGVIR